MNKRDDDVTESARDLAYESIEEGAEHSRTYRASPSTYELFLEAFGDHSPVHVDDAYARTRGFDAKVMHGALLNGFVSHFVGMHFPGGRSLLLTSDLRYGAPCYLGDELHVAVTVTQTVDSEQVIVLKLSIRNLTQDTVAATGRLQVRVAGG